MEKYSESVTTRSGRAVSGAAVTVTVRGTGAAATLYSDNGLTPTSNPLTTNANGYFEFYAADGRYNLSISAAGIPPQSIVDILLEDPADSPSPTLAALAAPTGAGLMGFAQSGVGAAVRTALAKMQEGKSLFDYMLPGMIQDVQGAHVMDHTAAVQAAFTEAALKGFPLHAEWGTYNVTQIKTNAAVSIYGDGRDKSIINGTDRTKDVIVYECAYEVITAFFMRDLRVVGGDNGLITHNAEPAHITNCDFIGQREAGIWGGLNAFHWHVEGCRFIGGRYNIKFKGTGPSVPMDKSDAAVGISGQLNMLVGNWYIGAKQQAIHLNRAEGINILGGYFELTAANDAGGNAAWAATTAKAVDDVVNITSGAANGYVYRCTVAGTTGGAIPTSVTNGAAVVDGTVTWEVLGRRACLWVENNRGFRMIGVQGERNGGTPGVVVTGPSTYYYSSIIANNSIRQTYPAVGVELINENRVFIDNNHFIDNGAWIYVPTGSTVKGLIATGNIYQNDEVIAGTLQNYSFSGNQKQTSGDAFSPHDFVSGADYEFKDRRIEAQFLGNVNVTQAKTLTIAATNAQFGKGVVGQYEVQVGRYNTAGIGELSTYILTINKGYDAGLTFTWEKMGGNYTAPAWVMVTNTSTVTNATLSINEAGVIMKVIRKTAKPMTYAPTDMTFTIT